MTTEERLKELEIQQALTSHIMKQHSIYDEDFKQRILDDLEYLKERDVKVMTYIESQVEKENDKKEIRQAIKIKLASSGPWGIILLFAGIAWYAFTNWVRQGGH